MRQKEIKVIKNITDKYKLWDKASRLNKYSISRLFAVKNKRVNH